MIDRFRGPYGFLSNFADASVEYDGDPYPSVEHAYQAAKTMNREARKLIAGMTASGAKAASKILTIRSDWADVRESIMLDLLRQKFSQSHPD